MTRLDKQFKFRDRSHVYDVLISKERMNTAHQLAMWPEFFKQLWDAGYVIVQRPELRDKGNPSKRPWV